MSLISSDDESSDDFFSDDDNDSEDEMEVDSSQDEGDLSSSEDSSEDDDDSEYDDDIDTGDIERRSSQKRRGQSESSSEEEEDDEDGPTTSKTTEIKRRKVSPSSGSPGSNGENGQQVWKWWEKTSSTTDTSVNKWNSLVHNGPLFPPPYEPLPSTIQFKYNKKPVKLSEPAEEIAGFYAKLVGHPYTTKPTFNANFFADWRNSMNDSERKIITDLSKCDFSQMQQHYQQKFEAKQAFSKEDKLKIKKDKEALASRYNVATVDGHSQKIANYMVEPPGLFRGRGEHPKMGCVKKRVQPEDIIINCSPAHIPKPPEGHQWKKVQHDQTVTWLASWKDNVLGQHKYIMLNTSSRLKGEKDLLKYERARDLGKHIKKIREAYRKDMTSKDEQIAQRAVALYLIDELALRPGYDKDEEEGADTVGCLSLRVEHLKLFEKKGGKKNVVVFNFLGKDSIAYTNEVSVSPKVFDNLKRFKKNKRAGEYIFDKLTPRYVNRYLREFMPGLSAKVFRTYRACHTLEDKLKELTPENGSVDEKILAFNRAVGYVAVLCNHQRTVPKSFEKTMENIRRKIWDKQEAINMISREIKKVKRGTGAFDRKTAQIGRLKAQLEKLVINKKTREEGKSVAPGTSKMNYLDPRIVVAWTKKFEVPIGKLYSKAQQERFAWATDMADDKYQFG